MKRSFIVVISVLICTFLLIANAYASVPPKPAQFNTNVIAPSFKMTAPGGQVLTSENYGAGKNMLLIYGQVYCGNTQAFLSGI